MMSVVLFVISMVGYQAVRLTQQAGVSSSGSSAATTATDSCELHPISGFVLCFCKEVVAFESVYQDLLEIAVSLLHVICFCRSSLCVCDTGCDCYGQDEISCPTSHLPPSTVAMESIVLVSVYCGYIF
jgi:hypothetical protein